MRSDPSSIWLVVLAVSAGLIGVCVGIVLGRL